MRVFVLLLLISVWLVTQAEAKKDKEKNDKKPKKEKKDKEDDNNDGKDQGKEKDDKKPKKPKKEKDDKDDKSDDKDGKDQGKDDKDNSDKDNSPDSLPTPTLTSSHTGTSSLPSATTSFTVTLPTPTKSETLPSLTASATVTLPSASYSASLPTMTSSKTLQAPQDKDGKDGKDGKDKDDADDKDGKDDKDDTDDKAVVPDPVASLTSSLSASASLTNSLPSRTDTSSLPSATTTFTVTLPTQTKSETLPSLTASATVTLPSASYSATLPSASGSMTLPTVTDTQVIEAPKDTDGKDKDDVDDKDDADDTNKVADPVPTVTSSLSVTSSLTLPSVSHSRTTSLTLTKSRTDTVTVSLPSDSVTDTLSVTSTITVTTTDSKTATVTLPTHSVAETSTVTRTLPTVSETFAAAVVPGVLTPALLQEPTVITLVEAPLVVVTAVEAEVKLSTAVWSQSVPGLPTVDLQNVEPEEVEEVGGNLEVTLAVSMEVALLETDEGSLYLALQIMIATVVEVNFDQIFGIQLIPTATATRSAHPTAIAPAQLKFTVCDSVPCRAGNTTDPLPFPPAALASPALSRALQRDTRAINFAEVASRLPLGTPLAGGLPGMSDVSLRVLSVPVQRASDSTTSFYFGVSIDTGDFVGNTGEAKAVYKFLIAELLQVNVEQVSGIVFTTGGRAYGRKAEGLAVEGRMDTIICERRCGDSGESNTTLIVLIVVFVVLAVAAAAVAVYFILRATEGRTPCGASPYANDAEGKRVGDQPYGHELEAKTDTVPNSASPFASPVESPPPTSAFETASDNNNEAEQTKEEPKVPGPLDHSVSVCARSGARLNDAVDEIAQQRRASTCSATGLL
eukprot:Hpha_TRINITY_DN15915_c5_g18::TRINITY_DN15915_c5_g18_i1::g.73317::m.73317